MESSSPVSHRQRKCESIAALDAPYNKGYENNVSAKVPEDIADEVWERGAFRKVNRVL
jgi:hypothetical protein